MNVTTQNETRAPFFGGRPAFRLRHRLFRLGWRVCWILLASWTPPQMRGWRRMLLRMFGARMDPCSDVRASAWVWYPPNLEMGAHSILGPGVICYNQAPVRIGCHSVISQRSHLCAGTHDFTTPDFTLVTRPIRIGDEVWVCSEAFVGPGATLGAGTVVGARGVVTGEVAPWTILAGNPARPIGKRAQFGRA
ncbi:MAG: putative colanic acid biosynthesis acetyltransferase [Rhodobacteraceae bacterium]|nr:putative colanic acid biosynthesis acetyltransferase [Paracoccaceae bacterium]